MSPRFRWPLWLLVWKAVLSFPIKAIQVKTGMSAKNERQNTICPTERIDPPA